MTSLSNELWQIGLTSMGRGAVLAPDASNGAAIGNSDSIGTPNRSTFNAMTHLKNGGVVLSTAAHDIQDDNNEKRSYS
jgi:hypothetical protein